MVKTNKIKDQYVQIRPCLEAYKQISQCYFVCTCTDSLACFHMGWDWKLAREISQNVQYWFHKIVIIEEKYNSVMKRTGILLYRENLNKGKIYTRRIFNTDRKSLL